MKHVVAVSAIALLLTSNAFSQTYVSEDFELGAPATWGAFVTVPAITFWQPLTAGQCSNSTAAMGFTGSGCATGARGFSSGGGLITPSFNLSGPPPYVLDFDSTLLMNLSWDSVRIEITPDLGISTVLATGFDLTNDGVQESRSIVIPPSFGGSDVTVSFIGDATTQGAGQLGWIIDNVRIRSTINGEAFCFGDGSANGCPCGNDVPLGTRSGCLNSSGVGAEIFVSGVPSASNDTLRFDVEGGPPTGFAILASGDNQLPLVVPGVGIPAFDGLRCTGGNLQRHGGRNLNANGANIGAWGEGGNPAQGLVAQGGFVVGQTRHWQIFYRDFPDAVCMTGRNFSNATSVTITP